MFPLSKSAVSAAARITAATLVLASGVALADPGEKDSPSPAIYNRDPDHVWNRIHAALFVRTGPDGKAYGQDRIEPLLWEDSGYLLRGEQADRAAAAMVEFVRENGESLITDPVKRAILQRDLWLVASWLAARPEDERGKLFEPTATAIGRLTLTDDQIARLPDTYAAAVASRAFAAAFDPEKPERAYLPPDLFDPAGPWVCVGRTDGPTAPDHLAANPRILSPVNRFTNSTFLTFLKLPAGREAGLAYLRRLARQKAPVLLPGIVDEKTGRTGGMRPNPNLPPLPGGTELALVRRALLIDTTGRIVASPLTESVQVRIFRSVPEGIPPIDGLTPGIQNPPPGHTAAFEFQLRRVDLFDRRNGGLRDVSEERDFPSALVNRIDVFQEVPIRPYAAVPFSERARPLSARQTCSGCHHSATIYGTFSFQRKWTTDETLDADSPPLYPIAPMGVKAVEEEAIAWKSSRPEWVMLREALRSLRRSNP